MNPEIKGLGCTSSARSQFWSGKSQDGVQKNTGKKMFTHPVPHVRREWCWLNTLKDARKEHGGLAACLRCRSLPLNADMLQKLMQ